jgi:hypothetical protein
MDAQVATDDSFSQDTGFHGGEGTGHTVASHLRPECLGAPR